MTKLAAGVDCSTQSTKVVVVDVESGKVVTQGQASHTVEGSAGARETHPDVWWDALRTALAQTGLAAEVAAVSVAGQQHGLVCLDESGRPLRPSMLWNDTRAAPDAARLVEVFGGAAVWAERVGVVPVASFTASKWAWLRRVEPETAAATAAIRLPHDYLTGLLAGAGVTDRGDASGTAWWSTADGAYLPEVLALPELALDPGLLPRVLGSGEAAGAVTAAAAEATGLRAGTIVGPGTGDNMGAALGLGLRPGVPVVSLGTSGTAYMVSETRAADPTGNVAGFADASGRFLPLAATLNCTLAVDRVAAWLKLERDDVVPSAGVVALPYFDGERTPNLPDAAAAFFGLRHDTDPRALLMATYEGAAVSLLEALDTIDSCSSGIDPAAPLVLIGGGARGATWQSVVRRLSGRAISIPEATELVAMGAAVQAASILLGETPQAVAARWQTDRGTLLPAVERDSETIERHRDVRRLAIEAITGPREQA
jgi:xylulokinase